MSNESSAPLTDVESWRAIVLYGQNTATYKIALAGCLAEFVQQDRARVTMAELAEAFFVAYQDRLGTAGRPQLLRPGRQTVMERIIAEHTLGRFDYQGAVDRVTREAFGDVLPRFHTLGQAPLTVRFYEATATGLVLTDNAFCVLGAPDRPALLEELGSRWDLLEAAFELKRGGDASLVNDIRRFYLDRGHDRTTVTSTRPVLNGYQQGRCFYCAELMADDDVHVDHLIPRQVVRHDDIWNLVLAHALCNARKSDALPLPKYVERLGRRNEHLIASNHPIRARLIAQLGPTAGARRATVAQVYEDARVVLGAPWEGPWGAAGFDPEGDTFYRSIVREVRQMTVYNKLVWDRIPEIIRASGSSCEVRVLGADEYATKLDEKLREEVAEYAASGDVEELADLVEVVAAILAHRGVSSETFERLRTQKRDERGGFEQRLLLERVAD